MDAEQLYIEFGDRLTRAIHLDGRSAAAISRQLPDLATKKGGTARHIQGMMNATGTFKPPRIDLMAALAEVLDVDPCWLAFGSSRAARLDRDGGTPPDDDRVEELGEELDLLYEVVDGLDGRVDALEASLKAAGLPLYKRREG